jgi:peptide/nickel transport system permease protein
VPVVTYLVTVFALVTLNFLLPRLMPGDPIDALFESGSPNYLYDEPLTTRYGVVETDT